MLFIAALFIIRSEWEQMPRPKIAERRKKRQCVRTAERHADVSNDDTAVPENEVVLEMTFMKRRCAELYAQHNCVRTMHVAANNDTENWK